MVGLMALMVEKLADSGGTKAESDTRHLGCTPVGRKGSDLQRGALLPLLLAAILPRRSCRFVAVPDHPRLNRRDRRGAFGMALSAGIGHLVGTSV
jgi:hypothetical protein